ncbi:MAG: FliH/SctL family protein [Candidatus Acidiferrales bacterium]
MTSRKRTSSEVRGADPAAPFVYHPAPGWKPPREDPAAAIAILTASGAAVLSAQPAPNAPSAEEQSRAREKQAWERGFQEGAAKARAESDVESTKQRDAVAEALRGFAQQRGEYFRRVEAEVVGLALAIARKVLRREAQIDPLLLSGMVRVALEKTAASQNVRLRVHPSQIDAWREHLAALGDLGIEPELSGDATLEPNQCQIETEMGVTELNLETHLKEIEQGLFDLLAQRPTPK